ncbi:hypothetical protein ABT275_39465 [Streptomyces sp. NPDC001185]|uniref:hypothetical protein n=1 Tax=Streptomyces sp. NPDC001185 TaxID=3154380 RepID=UPI003316E855
MATTDPYRLSVHDTHHDAAAPSVTRGEVTRVLLWLILVTSAAANMVASYAAASVAVNIACGAVTGLAATALVVRRLKGGRR